MSMHVLDVGQFSPQELIPLFEQAERFRGIDTGSRDDRRELAARHVGTQMYSLFYEPSTRTRTSFELAAVKMGMGLVSTENARDFSSAAKGESLENTFGVLNEFNLDVIVMRHDETGAAARAGALSRTPIINGGDGKGEHPTQAILDAHTIWENFRTLSGLHVVMGGDLKYGRTIRSLSLLLSQNPDNRFTYVSTPEYTLGDDIKDTLRSRGARFEETTDMYDALREANVVYWSRMQKERHEKQKKGLLRGITMATLEGFSPFHNEPTPQLEYVIDQHALDAIPQDGIVMHPGPQVGEIAEESFADRRVVMYRQAGNGLYDRMAMIDRILEAA